MSSALALVVRQVEIGCDGNIVSIEMICADDYGAQVVFDDIRTRLQSPQGLSLVLRGQEVKETGPTP